MIAYNYFIWLCTTILKANPCSARERQIVQKVTQQVLKEISRYQAPCCCQRDCWLALKIASKILP